MKRVSHRRTLLLTVGALCAGAFAAYRDTAAEAPPVSANLSAGAVAPAPKEVQPTGAAAIAAHGLLVGDEALRGEIDLHKARREGDHYVVPLSDGRRALLTLDPALQEAAESVLERAKAPRAAIVVMSTDGRLLALAGRRNEEPAREKDFELPLTTWAPAASVFKIVTAAALVDAGVGASSEVCYHGGLRSVEASNLTDDPRRDSACGDLKYGIAKSQNAIVAKLFHRNLGRSKLAAAARAFGFDAAARFALDVEPNRFSLPEDPLELARVASGFWSTELSPLGGALVANTIASGGMSVTPRIVSEIRGDGAVVPVVGAAPERVLDEAVAREVADMLTATCDSGTASKAFRDPRGRPFFPEVSIAGKTGSLSRSTPSYLGYSWFVGFAPADDPKIVVSVLLGNPAKWYLKAHTAARLVLDAAL